MIIGAISHITYGTFVGALAPVAAVGILLTIVLIALLNRDQFPRAVRFTPKAVSVRVHGAQMLKAAVVTLAVIGLFFVGMPVAQAALLGGALLLITRAIKARKVYREIDGSLLLMFAGLFVVVAGAEKVLLTPQAIAAVNGLRLGDVWILTAVTAALSNIISNVPAVLALKPFVQNLPDANRAWLVVAMSSTLAGNLTLIGSVANLIVAERARAAGIELSFAAYCRVGIPLTLLSLAFGAWWLS
jgi:Na+/H+ antiporter NhaD/arsenite permease-like protein